jgi:predicted DNA-binding transcriptional regulator AlpA
MIPLAIRSPAEAVDQELIPPAASAERDTAPSGPPVGLIDGNRIAELLAVSRATFARMKAARKVPAPIVLSAGCHRWKLAEVLAWIDAGCPARKEWEARQRRSR